MSEPEKTESDHITATRVAVIAAALPHVAFDGWSAATLEAAVAEARVDAGLARQAFPRGGIEMAIAFHNARDAELAQALSQADLAAMRYSERVAHAVMLRLELVAADREAVRRAAALFALPVYSAEGARAVWHTADTIWTALGDTSRDYNWYTKRATLSAVISSSLLYWLGDDSPGFSATREFVARRIENVMQFEKFKAQVRKNPLAEMFRKGPGRLLDQVTAPDNTPPSDLPGFWQPGAEQ
jgi:ubiquinone biosynthesis protein COQ9